MIVEEKLNEQFVKHYSDKGVKMKQVETGILYDDAIDVIPCRYTYEETAIPVERDDLADAINALNILGVE
jgi:hypothetical protein